VRALVLADANGSVNKRGACTAAHGSLHGCISIRRSRCAGTSSIAACRSFLVRARSPAGAGDSASRRKAAELAVADGAGAAVEEGCREG
jgi:hypothetical protein